MSGDEALARPLLLPGGLTTQALCRNPQIFVEFDLTSTILATPSGSRFKNRSDERTHLELLPWILALIVTRR
jgi:hypothetical protein